MTKDLVDWADKIFVMEDWHKEELLKQFKEARNKDIEILNVNNDYLRYDPELEKVLREKLKLKEKKFGDALEKYCALDTLAEVEIVRGLGEILG